MVYVDVETEINIKALYFCLNLQALRHFSVVTNSRKFLINHTKMFLRSGATVERESDDLSNTTGKCNHNVRGAMEKNSKLEPVKSAFLF
jgi:hypothetical protein